MLTVHLAQLAYKHRELLYRVHPWTQYISATDGGVQKTNDVCVSGQFWATPKTEVESVSKSKVYFETLSYKLEVHELTRKSIRAPNTDVAHF